MMRVRYVAGLLSVSPLNTMMQQTGLIPGLDSILAIPLAVDLAVTLAPALLSPHP